MRKFCCVFTPPRRTLRSALLPICLSIVSIAPATAASATSPGGRILGTTLDAAGAPVGQWKVRVEGRGLDPLVTTTREDGSFQFDVPAGSYRVSADSLAGGQPTEKIAWVTAGEDTLVDLRLVWLLQDSVTVSGTITRELTNVPGGTALVTRAELDRTSRHSVEDVLEFVPGVLAQSRWGADETQLSVRGSGLRNNFHHRGLNLLINGVVYQDADGFGDFETLDLMATERVEVWKGANALRYGGNTLGGAVNFVTYSGATAPRLEIAGTGGSFGLFKTQIATAGSLEETDYYVSASLTDLDGFRDHAEQERTRVFANLRRPIGDDLEVWADFIYADVSEKLPGALTREEFLNDPGLANPQNLIQDSGRFYDYGRMGFGVRRRFGAAHSLEATLFGQVRDVLHPIFQMLDQDQRTYGAEVRYSFEGAEEGRLQRFVVGFAPLAGRNDERRYENTGGQAGDLVGEFGADADNLGMYLESELRLASKWTAILGGRWDRAVREFDDRFLSDGDRSDERTFEALSPKLGILWRPTDSLELFANVSRAYEAPLTLELTSFGDNAGFIDLEAQDARQIEIGTRGRLAQGASWELSLYDSEIDNEIINENVRPFPSAPFTIPTYRNVERTRHRGVELGVTAPLRLSILPAGHRLIGQVVYTGSEFTFRRDSNFEGNDLPGAPPHALRAEVRYVHDGGLWIAPNLHLSPSDYYVDSANTESNDSFTVVNLRGGYDWREVSLTAEVSNLGDELYSGSVQVDSADGRYFEPASGRSFSIGLKWRR